MPQPSQDFPSAVRNDVCVFRDLHARVLTRPDRGRIGFPRIGSVIGIVYGQRRIRPGQIGRRFDRRRVQNTRAGRRGRVEGQRIRRRVNDMHALLPSRLQRLIHAGNQLVQPYHGSSAPVVVPDVAHHDGALGRRNVQRAQAGAPKSHALGIGLEFGIAQGDLHERNGRR